mgnify:CR=1 FL=1
MNDLELAIKLVPYLTAHGGITVDEVAREFGITTRKVTQLLKLLPYTGRGQFGGELIDINVTDDGAIYVHDAQSLDAPVKLNGNQAFANRSHCASIIHQLLRRTALHASLTHCRYLWLKIELT